MKFCDNGDVIIFLGSNWLFCSYIVFKLMIEIYVIVSGLICNEFNFYK